MAGFVLRKGMGLRQRSPWEVMVRVKRGTGRGGDSFLENCGRIKVLLRINVGFVLRRGIELL